MKSAWADFITRFSPQILSPSHGDFSYNVTVNALYYFKMHAKVRHVNPKGLLCVSP